MSRESFHSVILAGATALAIFVGAALIFTAQENRRNAAAQDKEEGSQKTASSAHQGARPAALDFGAWKKRIDGAPADDFARLIKEAIAISDPALRAKVMTALVGRWVGVDLKGFIAFVDESEVDDDGDGNALWALLAPALAEALPTLPDDVASRVELNEIVRRLIEYSARKDPVQAFAWAKQWLLDDAMESALATIAGEMIQQSPEQAMQVLAEIHSPIRRVDAIGAIAMVYGATHPEEATTWAKTLAVPAERPYAMDAVLAARAETEPEASAKDLIDFRDSMQAAYTADRDAEVAMMGIPDFKEHKDGEPLTDEELTNSELLPSKEDPQLRLLGDATRAIAENWAAAEPAKAMPWIESLPAGLKGDAIESALAGWASQQPEEAYAYYIKNHASDAAPAAPIFEAWAQAEPRRAAEQAARLTDAAIREQAVSGVVSGWLDSSADQSALEAWVDRLPTARERDRANAQIADAASYDEPAVAWRRATAIHDPLTRREELKTVFANLVDNDPGKARALLAETKSLTSDETNRLNKMLNAVAQKSSN